MTEIINYPFVFFMATVLNNFPEGNLPKIRRDTFSFQASSDLALPLQGYFVG